MTQKSGRSGVASFFSGLAHGIEITVRALVTAAFLAGIVFLAGSFLASRPSIPKKAALVLDIRGTIVEQLTARSPREMLTEPSKETLLIDLLDAVRLAKSDKRIPAIYLDLGEMDSAGMTKLEDVAAALTEFKKSGKRVVAYADTYSQSAYYLAATANEIYMHPDGMILIEGFSRYRMYYREAIDKLGIEWNIFRVGEYKSAVEPYLRANMSPEAREADLAWMGDIWKSYVTAVASARKRNPEELSALIDTFPGRVKAASGDMARIALEERLIDKIVQRDEFLKRMISLVGKGKDENTFSSAGYQDYLKAANRDSLRGKDKKATVAVIIAKGEILDGSMPSGTIGGDSTAALIRKAREDENVKAVVLRVDSPGGSAFASEVIRRECELTQLAKKPLVVSMGSVAASGGYWIATSSDEIWASKNTITGSIGIFGMLPTFEKALAQHLLVHVDGAATTPLAGAIRPDRSLDPKAAEAIQSIVEKGYRDFLERVAKARKMKTEDVDKIARGRVWSGADAFEAHLVDKIGSLPDAIASAAARAKLPTGYKIRFLKKERKLRDVIIDGLTARAATAFSGSPVASPRLSRFDTLAHELSQEASRLASWNDPRHVYAHCLCELP